MKSVTLLRALEDLYYKKMTGKTAQSSFNEIQGARAQHLNFIKCILCSFLLKSQCITSPRFYVNAGLRVNASLTVGFSCHIYRIKA